MIPWDHGKGKVLTVNLSLFCLIMLAQEERHLSHQYDSLDKKEKPRIAATHTMPEKRRRESESPGKLSQRQQKIQKPKYPDLFIPGESIHEEVIIADIGVYISGATARTAEHEGRHGFMVSQSRESAFGEDELVLMISDLKADTANWNKEGGEYKKSMVYKSRHSMADHTNDPDHC
jgi:hypothetical protein